MPTDAGTGARVGQPAGPGHGSAPSAALQLAGPAPGGVRADRPGPGRTRLPPGPAPAGRTPRPVFAAPGAVEGVARAPRRAERAGAPVTGSPPPAQRIGNQAAFARTPRRADGRTAARGQHSPPPDRTRHDRGRFALTPVPAATETADVRPVAPGRPHLARRGTATEHGGTARPTPTPRFAVHPRALRPTPERRSAESAAAAERRDPPGGHGEAA